MKQQNDQKATGGFQGAVARKLQAFAPEPSAKENGTMPAAGRVLRPQTAMQEEFAARREFAGPGYPRPNGRFPSPFPPGMPPYAFGPVPFAPAQFVPAVSPTVGFAPAPEPEVVNGPFRLPIEPEADPELRRTHNTVPFDEKAVGLRGMDAENEKLYRSLGEGFAKVAESDEHLDRIIQANYRRQAAQYQNTLLKDLLGLLNEIAGLIGKRRLYVETLIRDADSFQDPEGSRALVGELQLLNAEWKRLDDFKRSTVDKAEALRTALRSDLQGAYSAQREFEEKTAARFALAEKDAARFEFEKEKYEHQVADYTSEIQTLNTRLTEKRRRIDELLSLLREPMPTLPGDASEARRRRDLLRADIERLQQDTDDFSSRRHELEVRARNAASGMAKKRDLIAASKADLEALRNEQLDSARFYLTKLSEHERVRREIENSLETPNQPAFEALHAAKNYIKARELELATGMSGGMTSGPVSRPYPEAPYDPTYYARARELAPGEGEERSRLYLEDVAFDLIRDNCAAVLATLKEEIRRKRDELDGVIAKVNSQADAEGKKIDALVVECNSGLTDNVWDRRGMADDVKAFLNEKRGEIDMAMFAVSKQRESALSDRAELASLQLVIDRLDQLKQYVDYQLTQIAVGGQLDFTQINRLQAEITAAKARIRSGAPNPPPRAPERPTRPVRPTRPAAVPDGESLDGRLDQLRRIFARIDAEEKKIDADIGRLKKPAPDGDGASASRTWREIRTTTTTTQERHGDFDRELKAMHSAIDDEERRAAGAKPPVGDPK